MPADAAEIVRLATLVEQVPGATPYAEVRALEDAIYTMEHGKPPFNSARTPRYTASLDAAMTLVPDGQATECLNDATETLGVAGWNGRWRDALPRFLTAAALRARAQHDHEVG